MPAWIFSRPPIAALKEPISLRQALPIAWACERFFGAAGCAATALGQCGAAASRICSQLCPAPAPPVTVESTSIESVVMAVFLVGGRRVPLQRRCRREPKPAGRKANPADCKPGRGKRGSPAELHLVGWRRRPPRGDGGRRQPTSL